MELALLVWFAGVAEGLQHALTVVGFISSFLTIAGYGFWNFCYVCNKANPSPPKKRFALPIILICLSAWVVGLLIPNQKTIYLMTGAYVSQKIVQSEAADKVVKIINGKLDEYLKETEEKLSSKEKK